MQVSWTPSIVFSPGRSFISKWLHRINSTEYNLLLDISPARQAKADCRTTVRALWMTISHDKQPSSSAVWSQHRDIFSTRATPIHSNFFRRRPRSSFPSSETASTSASILLHSCVLNLNLGYSKVKAEKRVIIPFLMDERKGTTPSAPRPWICLTTVSTKRRMVT